MSPRHAAELLALAVSLSLLLPIPAARAQDPPLLAEWTDPGLSGSLVMALDPVNHWIYTVPGDPVSGHSIQKYTLTGVPLTSWGSFPSRFFDIAVGPDGAVYLLDCDSSRVRKFTSSGTLIREWGQPGIQPGQFDLPKCIAVGADGYVYVSQAYNDVLQKFTSDGAYVTRWTTNGYADHMAVNSEGDLYLSIAYGNCVRKYSGTTYRGQFGTFAASPSLAVDGSGQALYAGEYYYLGSPAPGIRLARIVKFTMDGTQLFQWGSYGTGPGQFTFLTALTVDAIGNLYVLCGNSTGTMVRVYGTGPVAATPTSWSRIKASYR